MAPDTAIQCIDLGKRYFVRSNDANPVKRFTRSIVNRNPELHEHWALRDINLTINHGESVALIGVNGSGKSTLLKLITGITRRTTGQLHVNGRVGGIIDLSAGFHPDLTGFENIFLQATLMGLSRQMIWQRLKSIEDFCELGDFLNVPIRTYSMGMNMRLAFAVAVHTDPEIFIIDEALAVGDGYFMWKCLKKLEQMKSEGKTLLYVSHVPEMVESLCDRAIWIHGGRVREDGPLTTVVQDYQRFQFADLLEGEPKFRRPELTALIPYARYGTGDAIMRDVKICDEQGSIQRFFNLGQTIDVHIQVESKIHAPRVSGYLILEKPGASVAVADSYERNYIYSLKKGANHLIFRIPDPPLTPGPYFVTLAIGETQNHENVYDAHQKIYNFTIIAPQATSARYTNGFLTQPTQITQTPTRIP